MQQQDSSSTSSVSTSSSSELSSKNNKNLESIPESQVWSRDRNHQLDDDYSYYPPLLSNHEQLRRSKLKVGTYIPRTSSSEDSVNTNTTGYISDAEQAV